MVGSMRWNIVLSAIGAILTMLFSSGVNGLAVTMLRGLYAAIAFFILAYLLRLALGLIIGPQSSPVQEDAADGRGTVLDMATPDDEDDLNRLLRVQMEESGSDEASATSEQVEAFQPLSPPKLVSKQQNPEQLADALRKLKDSDEDK